MAISAAKLEANRRNAQKSTGPRTEEGKNRSKLNAVTHGGRAETLVLRNEDPAAPSKRDGSPGWPASRHKAMPSGGTMDDGSSTPGGKIAGAPRSPWRVTASADTTPAVIPLLGKQPIDAINDDDVAREVFGLIPVSIPTEASGTGKSRWS